MYDVIIVAFWPILYDCMINYYLSLAHHQSNDLKKKYVVFSFLSLMIEFLSNKIILIINTNEKI